MAEALAKVKRELGNDAVIMHTRTLKRGGVLGVGSKLVVEITAGSEGDRLPAAPRKVTMNSVGGYAPYSPPAMEMPETPVMRTPQAEGAAVSRAFESRIQSAPVEKGSAPGGSLRQEMDELRGMVRELLNRTPAQGGSAPEVPEELHNYYTKLIKNEVADEIAKEVLTRARKRWEECRKGIRVRRPDLNEEQAMRRLVPAIFLESVEKMIPDAEPVKLPADGSTKYVSLIGPTGVGKTTTIAKLAAHFKLREQKKVGLVTIDTYRIAAVDQLRAYADIMSIPLRIVLTPEEMAEAIDELADCDVVLIDTAGRSQNDTQRLGELREFLDVVRAHVRRLQREKGESDCDPQESSALETHLVLSCTAHPQQMMEVARKFSVLGVDRVVFTKLDEAVGIGVIFNVVHRLNLRLSYLTTGQDVPDDIEVSHRRRVAEMILGRGQSRRQEEKHKASPAVDHVA